MSDWEVARRCPACNVPGHETGKRPAPSGDGNLIELHCKNTACPEINLPWYVQVRSDGTIPEPTVHKKENVIIDQAMHNPGLAQQIRDALTLQNEMTMKPGGAEIPFQPRG